MTSTEKPEELGSSVGMVDPNVEVNELDLRYIATLIWKSKWVVIAVASLGLVGAIFFVLTVPPKFTAEATLAPNNYQEMTGASNFASQLGGLAGIAGISLGDRSIDRTDLAIEILKSRRFIFEFIELRSILVPLFAARRWNRETNSIVLDADIYNENESIWVRKVNEPRKPKPSLQEAYEKFMDVLSISKDKDTQLVTITVTHISPEIAKMWVNWLVEDINRSTLERDVTEAEQAIGYLHEQIESTSLDGLRSIFYRLIEEQTKTIMLARVSPEYTFRTIDPAVAPEEPVGPPNIAKLLVGVLVGGFVGVLLVLLASSLRSRRYDPQAT
jgi:uncharacterized protein involved in exopolysaccharide biosynthesis